MSIETIRARHADEQRAAEHVASLEQALEGLRPAGIPGELRQAAARAAAEYEDACAAHALGDGTAAQVSAAKKALDSAQQSLQEVEAANRRSEASLAGVARRLEAAQAAHRTAVARVADAETQWALSEVEKADRIYVEAGRATAAALARVVTLNQWLAQRGHPARYPTNSMRLTLHPIGPVSVQAYKEIFPKHAQINWSQNIVPHFSADEAREVIAHEIESLKGDRGESLAGRVLRGVMAAAGLSKATA